MAHLNLETATKEEFVNALILASDDPIINAFYMKHEEALLSLDFDRETMFDAFEDLLIQNSEV